MSELLKLAERCETASGPERELDAAIARLLMIGDVESDDGDFWVGRYDELPARVPDFTASLDAAMTMAGSSDYSPGNLREDHPFSVLTAAMAACPLSAFSDLPRYVCAAALRARATGEQPA